LLESKYTEPGALPPLEIHFSGKNGPYILSNKNRYPLTESQTGSQLPGMHAARHSRQLRRGGRCRSSQFSSNIPCLERSQ
jgi:hypothetical protein